MGSKTLRTVENYHQDVTQILTVGTKLNYHGIKANSVQNDLHPGLPPCAAHDLFEGCFSEDMKLIIDYFISLEVFDYDELNLFHLRS